MPRSAAKRTFRCLIVVAGLALLIQGVSSPLATRASSLQHHAAAAAASSAFTPIRVNAGGGTYTDSAGNAWSADTGFTGGGTYATTAAIAGTTDPTLYQTERTGQNGSNFSYSFPVPTGDYTVTLKFAEIYWTTAGSRVFNVAINGQTVLSNFDILAVTQPKTALDEVFRVHVSGSTLDLAFTTVKDNAKVSAIQIVDASGTLPPAATGTATASPTATATSTPSSTATTGPPGAFTPIRVNAGGGTYTDSAGNAWSADTGFTGGTAATNTGTVAGTTDPTLYLTKRYGNFSYSFAVPNGTYALTFKFVDMSNSSPGQRVFNVAINGQTVLSNFDIIAAVGPKTALDKTFVVNATGGTLSISFTSVTGNAVVNAIQIVSTTDTAPTVVGTWPADGATGVVLNTPISVTFSAPMARTATQNAFVLTPSVAGSYRWNSDSTVLTFMPAANLAVTTTYTATVSTAAQSLAGTALASARRWAFTTGATLGAYPGVPFAWTTDAPSPITRFESQGLAVNGKLYNFGGFYNSSLQTTTRVDAYDPATDSWTRLSDLPELTTHAAVVADGQTIWLVGGFVGNHPGPSTTHVWKYDIPTNTWSAGPSLPADRGAGAAVIIGRKLYFYAGGQRLPGTVDIIDTGEQWVLNLDGGTSWSSLAPVPNPRNHITAETLNGIAYVIGGQHHRDETAGNQSEVDAYDPATNTWTRLADLPAPRGHINSFVMNGRIVVMGGTLNGNVPAADVTEYDPATNTWLKLPSLPAGRKSPIVGLIGNQIVSSTGASSGGGTPSTDTWTGVLATHWEQSSALPVALGDVAGGILTSGFTSTLYLVGQGSAATLGYNLASGSWSSTTALATRPYVDDHHAAEVVNNKLYLIGGLSAAAGQVQIYDAGANSWSTGAAMPYPGGAVASALIGGKIYVAGGLVSGSTTAQAAVYDPGTNTWTAVAPMPHGVYGAAAGTDGRKLWVFGGRDGGASVTDGYAEVQVYDPATNSWVSSNATGATLAPLPQGRGGLGKADYANGEFYVLGGETATGAGATAQYVYNRVDIYNPATNTWRTGTPMLTARHGLAPVQVGGRIYVGGGGVQAGTSSSTVMEVYNIQ